jgi:hypothetical protein
VYGLLTAATLTETRLSKRPVTTALVFVVTVVLEFEPRKPALICTRYPVAPNEGFQFTNIPALLFIKLILGGSGIAGAVRKGPDTGVYKLGVPKYVDLALK